jgi:hypothetical protein
MKNNSLLKVLSEVKDPRRGAGQRHSLPIVLVLVLMATMSGYFGYRGIGDFITRNRKDLLKYLKPKKDRLPSFSTVRRVMQEIDYEDFTKGFYDWAVEYVEIEKGDWLSLDGKAIRGTVTNGTSSEQNFVSLISVFSEKSGQILSVGKINNSKESEIPKIKELIKQLDLEGVVFTIDALHCQKKQQQQLSRVKTTM